MVVLPFFFNCEEDDDDDIEKEEDGDFSLQGQLYAKRKTPLPRDGALFPVSPSCKLESGKWGR